MKPWKHQTAALAFAARRGYRAILAMGMGTGKTLVAIETIRDQVQPGGTVLVIAPKRVALHTWPGELRKHNMSDGYQVVPLRKGTSKAKARVAREAIRDADIANVITIILCGYESATQPALMEVWRDLGLDAVIFDEIHRIKAPKGKASKACAQIPARIRLGLTGTPAPHSILDVWGQCRALDPTVFGSSYFRFRARYARMGGYRVGGKPVQVVGFQNLEEFEAKFASIAFQVGDEVLDLPELHHVVRDVELPATAREVYDGIHKDYVALLEGGDVVTATNAAVRVGKCLEVSGGTILHDVENDEGAVLDRVVTHVHAAKREALEEILEDIGSEELFVVFARYRGDLDQVGAAALGQGRPYFEISGRSGDDDLPLWRESTGGVLGVQIQSGGVGLDFTAARYGAFWSTGHNLGDYEQAVKRLHRPGQTQVTTYFHLHATRTLDGPVYKALRERRDFVGDILDRAKAAQNAKG